MDEQKCYTDALEWMQNTVDSFNVAFDAVPDQSDARKSVRVLCTGLLAMVQPGVTSPWVRTRFNAVIQSLETVAAQMDQITAVAGNEKLKQDAIKRQLNESNSHDDVQIEIDDMYRDSLDV